MQYKTVNIDVRRKANLIQLANYLKELPLDYEHFDMAYFVENEMYLDDEDSDNPSNICDLINQCGTVACAVGHGPLAGIDPKHHTYWVGYVNGMFCDFPSFAYNASEHMPYNWCFEFFWEVVDNTPHGAAARILYMIKYGIPTRFCEIRQKCGDKLGNWDAKHELLLSLREFRNSDQYQNEVLGILKK